MPLYFFDTFDGSESADDDGIELENLTAAKACAIELLADLLKESGGSNPDVAVRVRDQSGAEVLTTTITVTDHEV